MLLFSVSLFIFAYKGEEYMKKIKSRVIKIINNIVNKVSSKLVSKLIFLFTALIVTIVVSLTFISYKIIQRESIKNIINSNTNNLNLVNKNFERYFSDIKLSSFPQFNYDKVMNAVVNEADDYTQRAYIEDYLRSFVYLRKDISSVYLYLPNEKKYYYIERGNNDLKVKINYNSNIPRQEWYELLMGSITNTYIQPLYVSKNTGYLVNNNEFIAFHRVLRNITDKRPLAVISLYFNSLERDDILSDIPSSSGEQTILLDSANKTFYVDSNKSLVSLQNKIFSDNVNMQKKDHYFYFKQANEKFLVIYDISKVDNWKLIKLIPYSEINKVAKINSRICILVGAIFLVLSVLLITITSNSITRPLKELNKKMDAFGKGNFEIKVDINGRDEIAQLSKQFNEMVKKIDELINDQYKMKLAKKNAILKALEAELNPHFLYNALQAISTKALKSGLDDVSDMVDALALNFRYCINGVDIVEVRDEIKHVENYLIIQKARYGDRLEVIYDLQEIALNFKIPKLSIQSLVENSIKHAIEERSTITTIVIKVVLDGMNARITVRDNGPGIDKDRLCEIYKSLNSEWIDGEYKCIGLKNLNTRLKLIFGEEAGLIIKSDETGTEVNIIIPEGEQV